MAATRFSNYEKDVCEMTSLLIQQKQIRQIAYVVPDIRMAAARHFQLFGSGPYFLAEHLTLSGHIYRGSSWSVDIDVALGQWGEIQIELIQPNDDRPSLFREVMPKDSRHTHCHHVCLHPPGIETSIASFEAQGYPVVFDFPLPGGTRVVLIDTLSDLGHFVELYERTPEIARIYDYIQDAARHFDGTDLIRPRSEMQIVPP
jgi:hypothetical protein